MSYSRTVVDKVNDLERYVNWLTTRMKSESQNTVVFYCEQQAVSSLSAPVEFEVELVEDEQVELDLNVSIAGSASQINVNIVVNSIILQSKTYSSTNACCFRIFLPFWAMRGTNTVQIQLTSNAQTTLSSLTAVFKGKRLLSKAVSHVGGVFNQANGLWTFCEGKNNVFSIVDQTLSTFVRIKIFDGVIDKVGMNRMNNKNYAFVLSNASLFCTECNLEAKTSRLANSVSDFAVVQCEDVDNLFVVCRNRLFKREVNAEMSKASLVPLSLNISDKIYGVCATQIDSQSYVLCIETTNRAHIYLFQNGNFTLVQTLVTIGMCSCFFQNGVVYVLSTANSISRLFKVDIQTQAVDISSPIGSFDSMFQYASNKALASSDNKLQLVTLP